MRIITTTSIASNTKERTIRILSNKVLKGIYLGAYLAHHPNYNIEYQDINGLRDINGCMLEVNLNNYDYIISTPPCNYYSRGNYRRNVSTYSLSTKHILPSILEKCIKLGKPFIVENVRNKPMYNKLNLLKLPCYVYFIGRHTYWSNIEFDPSNVVQVKDNINFINPKDRQGGINVHNVVELFLERIH